MRTRVAAVLGLHHRPVAGLFGMTVTVVLGLGVVYLSHSFLGIPEWTGVRLGSDRAVPEIVGYLFAAWSAGLALYLAVTERQAVLAAWSAVFAVLLVDDYLMLHERVAVALSPHVGLPYAHPAAEIVWLGGVGLVLLTAIAFGYRFATPEWRAASRVLAVLLGLLVLCGVGIDAVHALTPNVKPWNVIFILLEDGGELFFVAVATTFLYGLAFCGHRSTPETLAWRRPLPESLTRRRPAADAARRHGRSH